MMVRFKFWKKLCFPLNQQIFPENAEEIAIYCRNALSKVCYSREEVEAKLKSKEFTTRKRVGSMYSSSNWSLFHEIVTNEELVVSNFVYCTNCNLIKTYSSINGTNNLTRHMKSCKKENNTIKNHFSKKNLKIVQRDKDQVLQASKRFCYKDLRPFVAIEGDGLIELLHAVSAVTLRQGLLSIDDIKSHSKCFVILNFRYIERLCLLETIFLFHSDSTKYIQ